VDGVFREVFGADIRVSVDADVGVIFCCLVIPEVVEDKLDSEEVLESKKDAIVSESDGFGGSEGVGGDGR